MNKVTSLEQTSPLIEFNHVSVEYANRPKWLAGKRFTALDNFSLRMSQKSLAIVGPSGAGKSTIVDLLFGVRTATKGHISVLGQRLPVRSAANKAALCRAISLIPQEPHTSLNPFYSVKTILLEPLRSLNIQGDHQAIAQQALQDVGLGVHLLNFMPSQLSTGQAQRVAIARALVVAPQILVADEPTSSLDPVNRQTLINLLNELKVKRQMRLLLITHDLTAAHALCDDMLVLANGVIVEHATSNEVMKCPSHPVTQALIAAQPCLTPPH